MHIISDLWQGNQQGRARSKHVPWGQDLHKMMLLGGTASLFSTAKPLHFCWLCRSHLGPGQSLSPGDARCYSTEIMSKAAVTFKKKFFLIIFRREGRGKENWEICERDTRLSNDPSWRPGLKPRQVAWLGIELTILWFTNQHSIHWATPVRAAAMISNQTLPPECGMEGN